MIYSDKTYFSKKTYIIYNSGTFEIMLLLMCIYKPQYIVLHITNNLHLKLWYCECLFINLNI